MKTVTVYGLPATFEDSRVPLLKILETNISEATSEIDSAEPVDSVNIAGIHNQYHFSPEVVVYVDGFVPFHAMPSRFSDLKKMVNEKISWVIHNWLMVVRKNSKVRVDDVVTVKVIVS